MKIISPAALIFCVSLAAIAPPAAYAQFEDADIPATLLRPTRTTNGQNIAFCVNTTSILADFDRAIASEIASALLIEHEIVEVVADGTPPATYDFRLPLYESEIYLALAHRCDVLMGYTQLANYPDWLTLTPPYLTTHTVLAVRAGEGGGADPLAPGRAVGSRFLSMADSTMLRHLQVMPESEQWQRIIYPDHGILIERLLDGSVDSILVWEPAIRTYIEDHPEAEGIEIISDLPFDVPATEFGMVMLRSNDFLHSTMTEAVVELTADGTFDRVAASHGLVSSDR